MGTDTAPNPPLWEAKLARLAFTRSVARHADSTPNPGLAELKTSCASDSGSTPAIAADVHGFPNHPSSFGLSFYPRAKQFAETPPTRPDWQNYWIMTHGSGGRRWRPGNIELPEEKRWQVATFVSELGHCRRRWTVCGRRAGRRLKIGNW